MKVSLCKMLLRRLVGKENSHVQLPIMNGEEYKSLINQKDVLSHTTLNVTLKELVSRHELELAERVRGILNNNKIAKPELHTKPYDISTTYYKVYLPPDDIEKIIEMFLGLEARHIGEDGETTPTASFYASLVDIWNQLH